MLSLFLLFKKLINFLNSNESIENIALSLTIALVMALIPFNFIFHPLAFIFLIAMNGNLFIFLFMMPILRWLTPMVYSELHSIGKYFLMMPSLTTTFESMSNIPFLIFINWNNSVSLGGYLTAIIISYPLYLFYKIAIQQYRIKVLPKIKASKLFHLLKVPNFINIFKS